MKNLLTFDDLLKIVNQSIDEGKPDSYCASLAQKGAEKIGRKIGEEAVEVLIAAFMHEREASDKTRQELVGELCDLFFHSLVLMAEKGIKMEEVLAEFYKRHEVLK